MYFADVHPAAASCDMVLPHAFRAGRVRKTGIGGEVRYETILYHTIRHDSIRCSLPRAEQARDSGSAGAVGIVAAATAISASVYIYIYTYVCMYVYICIYTYIILIYIYIYTIAYIYIYNYKYCYY